MNASLHLWASAAKDTATNDQYSLRLYIGSIDTPLNLNLRKLFVVGDLGTRTGISYKNPAIRRALHSRQITRLDRH